MEINDFSDDGFFEGNKFSKRSDAISFILNKYGRNTILTQRNENIKRSSFKICLQCKNIYCGFIITCFLSRQKNTENYFQFDQENSLLEHGKRDNCNNVIEICSSQGRMSTVSNVIVIYIYL